MVKNSRKLCDFFHVPLQSGNQRILKDMNRNYSLSDFEKLVSDIKREIPTAMVGTDIIVGFPDETEQEFEETTKFLEKIELDHLHVFSYSPRRGTVAEKFKNNNVTNEEKKNRVTMLLELGKVKKTKFLNSLMDREFDVIVEKKVKNSYIGKADNFADIIISESKRELVKGMSYPVKIKSLYKEISLEGDLVL